MTRVTDVSHRLVLHTIQNTGQWSSNGVFTATCFSNVAVMGSLDVRPSVRNVGEQ